APDTKLRCEWGTGCCPMITEVALQAQVDAAAVEVVELRAEVAHWRRNVARMVKAGAEILDEAVAKARAEWHWQYHLRPSCQPLRHCKVGGCCVCAAGCGPTDVAGACGREVVQEHARIYLAAVKETALAAAEALERLGIGSRAWDAKWVGGAVVVFLR